MMGMLRRAKRKWDLYRFQRKINRALALQCRGEARRDGPSLNKVHAHLEIEWRARDIHPWDLDCPLPKRRSLLFEQTLADVDAVLRRLFDSLPQVCSVNMRVLEAQSERAIMAGLVYRWALDERRPLSNQMWLRQLGLHFRVSDYEFEPVNLEKEEARLPMGEALNGRNRF
jgi:hypothetical protein